MKDYQLFKGRFSTAVNSMHAHRRYVLVVVLLLSLTIVNTAYAAFTWDPDHYVTGPTWDQPGYTLIFTATVTSPQTKVCFDYYVNNVYIGNVECTGVSPTWTCHIEDDYYNARIRLWFIAGSGANCVDNQLNGPTDWFTTGPTAVKLSSFTAENVTESSFSTGSVLMIAGGVVLLLLALWQGRKLLKGKSA
jgi:hypothetical protein